MNKELIDLLYRSFDEILSPDEQAKLNNALAKNYELREEKESIERVRQKISGSGEKSFSPGFANRVMNGIRGSEGETSDRIFESIYVLFRPLAVAATIIILFMASFNLYKSETLSWESALVVPEVSFQDAYDPVIAFNMEN